MQIYIILFLILLAVFFIIQYGKGLKEKEVIKANAKVQKKIKNVKLKLKKDIIKDLKKGSLILLIILMGCHKKLISTACPEPINFSPAFQENLARDLEQNNSYFIDEVVIRFFYLNEQVRLCNEK